MKQRIKAQASPSLPRHSTHRMIIAACLRRRRATNTQPTMAEPMDDQPCMTIRKHSRGRHVRWFSPTRTPGREATPRDSLVCREAPPRDPLAGSEARARPHPLPCPVYLIGYIERAAARSLSIKQRLSGSLAITIFPKKGNFAWRCALHAIPCG